MHIYNMSEKIKVVLDTANWMEADDYLMMRRLYQYICQFQTFRLFSENDTPDFVIGDHGILHAPDYIYTIAHMKLEIDGQSVSIDSMDALLPILQFAEKLDKAHEAILSVNYGVNRVNGKEDPDYIRFHPAFEFFDLGELETKIAANVGIWSQMQVPDITDEAYFYHYSGIGETWLTTGDDHMNCIIEDAKKCSGFYGDYLTLGVDLPLDADPKGIEEIKEMFTAFEEIYETSELNIWETLIEEYDGRMQGGGWASFWTNGSGMPGFIRDLEKLNEKINSLAPDATLILNGPMVSEDPEHPFTAVYFSVNDQRKMEVKVMKLPD